MKYDIFLSYRRTGGSERAELIKEILLKNGYGKEKIFMDTRSLRKGDYKTKLSDAIENSRNVVVILSLGCFDVAKDNDVWIYEIAKAIELKKNIIPVFFDGIRSFDDISLPQTIKELAENNAICYNHEYADAFYKKLLSFLKKEKTINPRKQKITATLKSILFILLIAIVAFLVLFSVGFAVGYYSNLEKSDEVIKNALHDHKLSVIDKQTIRYNGDFTSFDFNVETGDVKFDKGDQSIFGTITIERVVASATFPILFSRLFKSAEHSGKGRTQVFFIIGGTIGIVCGYGVGNYAGEQYSIIKNEMAVFQELSKEETRLLLKDYINTVNK